MDRIQADHRMVKKLGHWTTGREVEVRARRGAAVLDLRSRAIPPGDIEVRLDLDHAMVKLLVPDDAVVDSWDLRWSGRRSWAGKVKDWTGQPDQQPDQQPEQQPERQQAAGRRIRLTGEVRTGEIRVHRGGIAVLSAMFSRAFVDECREAHRTGTGITVLDPG
jgi:hypothetical protein